MPLTQLKNIAVAMSGGVDSSVTAALLKKQGHKVQGVFMALAQPDLDAQIARVKGVADFLGIGLTVVDLAALFKREVLDYFCDSYFAGKTPNPCVVCNRRVKFGGLLDFVRAELAADLLATGHYARIEADGAGCRLLKGKDNTKDQSYFLSRLTQAQLARLCFPLGELRKKEVYLLAAELGLSGRHGSESQDVCFLKNQSVADFLAAHSAKSKKTGAIVTVDGRRLGSHQGVCSYTVGQRRGLGIPDATPYYVVGLDPVNNQVIVGKDEDLWHDTLLVAEMNWSAGVAPELPAVFDVKIRYRHGGARAQVIGGDDGRIEVKFVEPQRAITPGQFAVFYQGDQVVGGGEIAGVG
ncbi:MAG: tRNA 2-thiouridine(34) synthase MnmA [Desulfobulbaceae bacterium]|nr:tRNA 2-thiouridine(34) synthase MnmA [Desulfobulbaceae bacterium]